MPAPVIVKSAALAASRSKALRRVLLVLAALAIAFTVTVGTIIALPVAILASSGAAPEDPSPPGGGPIVVGDWGYPYVGDYYKGRGFGYNPVEGCSYCSSDHKGYDMSQGCGSQIYSAGPGTVTIAGSHYGWGNTVMVDHGDRIETLYGHTQWGSIQVQPGQQVVAGTPLGLEGNTGNSFGCHLHFEVRIDGTAIPPESFMAVRGLPLK
tara:strand:- start:461 stop:1087 length:627 start_codon:yes stop_codon:yes gene_type:complete